MRVGLVRISGSAAALIGVPGSAAALLYIRRVLDVDLPNVQPADQRAICGEAAVFGAENLESRPSAWPEAP